MDNLTLAYLAGAMDSDGFFTIKRSTYHRRVRLDAKNPTYSERCGLKQVTPQIPELLQSTFGGSLYRGKPGSINSKPLWIYNATDKIAARICEALLPYLRIKRRQAELILELRHTKDGDHYGQYAYWFVKENPQWARGDLLTTSEAAAMIGYTHRGSMAQAIRNGTLVALPYDHIAQERPRIPRPLVELVAENMSKRGRQTMPPHLLAWRHELHEQIRGLNKIGIDGTPIYHRTGPYVPLE